MSYIEDNNSSMYISIEAIDGALYLPMLLYLCIGEVYEKVVFLYEIVEGRARGSYGLNVAALAGLSRDILSIARRKSVQIRRNSKLPETVLA